ncbi:MAG: type II CAAX prenyl endopeptidase Rce1 family protein [Bacillota bacterium]
MELQNKENKITIFGGNLVFLICILLLMSVGSVVQSIDLNSGILITEFLLIAAPAFIYTLIKRDSIRRVFRFNKLSITDVFLVAAIFLSGYFVAIFINILGNIIVSLFGQLLPNPVPFAENSSQYMLYILLFAGSAGICEEILFRGLVMRSYEKLGMWKSIGLSSVLFGIMHLNVQNLLGPMFLGVLLGYVVYKTDSIFAGMLGHFINNAVSVSLGYVIMNLPFYKNMDIHAAQSGVNTLSLIVTAVLFGIIAVFAGAIMIFAMMALNERSKGRQVETQSIGLGSMLKNIRVSWPIYAGVLVFLYWAVNALFFISTGTSLLKLFFGGM